MEVQPLVYITSGSLDPFQKYLSKLQCLVSILKRRKHFTAKNASLSVVDFLLIFHPPLSSAQLSYPHP